MIASVVAEDLPAPGMDLTFEQSYEQSISGRYTPGILGLGWTTNWDISATTMPNGDVVIENAGTSEYFSLQPDGTFAPVHSPGDDALRERRRLESLSIPMARPTSSTP